MTDGTTTNANRICVIDDCERRVLATGYCGMHYQRIYKFGDPNQTGTPNRAARLPKALRTPFCSIEGCGNKRKTVAGYCDKHALRLKRTGTTEYDKSVCSVEGCKRPYQARGFCQMHFLRVQKTGSPGSLDRRRRKPLLPHEYVMISTPNGQVLEHRHIMSLMIGRPLTRKETVHHVNGDKHDNREKNLELWSTDQPPGQRVADKVEFAVELLEMYAPHLLA